MTAAISKAIHGTYDDYKDSGLPWVGKIPDSWTMYPNKAFLKKRKIAVGSRFADLTLLSLTKQGVIVRDVESGKGKFSIDMSSYQEVRPGDLIFCLFDIEETPRTVGLAHDNGMITGAYTVFECKDELISKFLELFYIAMDNDKRLSYLYSGLRNTIPPPKFLSIQTPLPSRSEMERIVDIVNSKNKLINKVIKKKEKLIELLKEKRQALITQAVTKGLDSKTKMKDSGVEWIGEIPEGWGLKKLKHVFKIQDTRLKEDRSVGTLLSVSGYKGVIPKNLEGNEGQMPSEDVSEYRIVRMGQLVVNTMWLNYTGLGVSKYEGYVSPAYRAYEISEDIEPAYAHHLLRSSIYVQKYSSLLYGVRPNSLQVKPYDFDSIEVLMPPKIVQKAIAEKLDIVNDRVDSAIAKTELQIKKLQEYKSALIYNAVTGKIKV